MKILVTGSAGFIGAATTMKLLEYGHTVVGIDNHSNYYDRELKEARVKRFITNPNYFHERIDLIDYEALSNVFEHHRFDKVVNLAAQAGVRYSLENPALYLKANIIGFGNILEICKKYSVKHLVYASSSSVYGNNKKIPFSITDNTDHPLSVYAATKKTNELMAYTYSHLYGLATSGLRFFTVYGPWCRPDMALYKFAKAIVNQRPIQIYNNGLHKRDFTYVDDIVDGVLRSLEDRPNNNYASQLIEQQESISPSSTPYEIYNLGNGNPVDLMIYILELENALGIQAIKEYLPTQLGDVENTCADIHAAVSCLGYSPKTSLRDGVSNFVKWFLEYEKI